MATHFPFSSVSVGEYNLPFSFQLLPFPPSPAHFLASDDEFVRVEGGGVYPS